MALTPKTLCSILFILFGVKATFVLFSFSKDYMSIIQKYVLQLIYLDLLTKILMDHVQNLFCYTYFFNHEQIH